MPPPRVTVLRRLRPVGAAEPGAAGSPRDRLATDALLLGASCGFAVIVTATSSLVTHRLWAGIAAVTYGVAATGCAVLAVAGRSYRPAVLQRARALVLGGVVVGAVLVPLAVAIALRELRGSAYTHDEVLTTERAGVSVLSGASPYDHGSTPAGAEPRRFPYLPLMALFGIPRALIPTLFVTDARLWFLIVALVAGGAGLVAWSPTSDVAVRVIQVTLALPIGAMGAVAGGHDLVVLALMLASLGLHRGGRIRGSALMASCAGLMKATAWPLWMALAAGWAASGWRTRSGRAVGLRLAVLPAGLVAMLAWDGPGLVADSVLFPLGVLDRVALPGSPGWAGMVPLPHPTASLGLVGGLLLAAGATLLAVAAAGSTAALARAAAGLAAIAWLLAGPAARPGLLMYPVLLALWSLLLARAPTGAGRSDEVPGGADGQRR